MRRCHHRRENPSSGEETGTLLEGQITLTISGQSYHLHAGQSYVIDTGHPHSFTNASAQPCRIVSAHTPPRFSPTTEKDGVMEHVKSYYAATMNDHAPRPALDNDIECDVCVIGGGFTGLSSALFLTEAGYDVVVLEAARVGFGASGRNGGQVVNSYSRDVDVIEKQYGRESAKMLGNMMFEGAEVIRDRIDRYAIDCDYRRGGILRR